MRARSSVESPDVPPPHALTGQKIPSASPHTSIVAACGNARLHVVGPAETRGYMLWDLRKRRLTHLGGLHGNVGPRNLCASPPLSRECFKSVIIVLCLYCINCANFLKLNKKIIKKEDFTPRCILCQKHFFKSSLLLNG